MGLFDDYFDPQQFEGGGLLGRLLSLQQQQGQYQPTGGFGEPDGQPAAVGYSTPQVAASPQQLTPSAASGTQTASASQAQAYGRQPIPRSAII